MMKRLVISALVVCVSVVSANVIVNQLNVEEPTVEIQRQDSTGVLPPVVNVTAPPKTCSNVTVTTQDCTSIIVTRLPFLFNFRMLNKVCGCEDKQLKCDRGVGSNLFERLQIPALRSVYNLNCKCKCPSVADKVNEILETSTASA